MHKHNGSLQTTDMQIGGVYARRISALATAHMATVTFNTYINVLLRKGLTFRELKGFFFLFLFSFKDGREQAGAWAEPRVALLVSKSTPHFAQRASGAPATSCCRPTLKSRLTISESDFVVTVGVENKVALKRKHGGRNLLKSSSGNLFCFGRQFSFGLK